MANDNYKSNTNVATGIFLIGGGLLFLAYKMGAPFPAWVFTWPTALIALGFYLGIKHSFRNFSWIALIGLGSFLLYDQQVPDLRLKNYLWPIFIIILGITFLFRDRNRRPKKDYSQTNWTGQNIVHENTEDDGEYINSSNVFGGTKKKIISKDFRGGKISCFFGGTEIDLTQADIQSTVVLEISQAFGGTKLVIPPHWKLKIEVTSFFAGMEDKRSVAANVDPTKILVITGSSVFAGIEITSY